MQHSVGLGDDAGGVVDVLEHLGAEQQVEALVLEGQVFGRRDDVDVRTLEPVDPHVTSRDSAKQRLVRPVSAADVDDLQLATLQPGADGVDLCGKAAQVQVVGPERARVQPGHERLR